MPLPQGTQLGPYEITAPLGVGGMGEVYRARDTRLNRTVAIKILPAHLSSDPVRKQRFEREAKTISSLNHPHICVLYDVGHQDGIDYLVMECVEGETLAARQEKGLLPLEQVLKYGAQIAHALEEAHRNAVVHRDLKPGNIMLTPAGTKLLDFGLAKPAAALVSSITLSAAAVPSSPVTEEGTIVGTFQYMSPEQVEGKEVDSRSDIFSLGAVLYEMLTGRRAFEGTSQLSVASAILEKEPEPISALKPMTPPTLEHVVKKCLAKHPDERWQSAGDLASELKWIGEAQSLARPAQPVAARRFLLKPGRVVTTIATLTVFGASLFVWGYFSRSIPQPQTIRAALPPPEGAAFSVSTSIAGSVGISPDGRLLVFTAQQKGGVPQLWLRSLDSLAAHPLDGTDYGFAPFWSPDSRWIGFFSMGKLRKIEVAGGPVETLCDAPLGRGGTWNRDGLIIYTPNISQPLFRVEAGGGACVPLTQLDASRQEVTHRWPQFLPDGKHYLFYVRATGSAAGAYVGELASNERRQVIGSSTNAVYSPPGYLLFGRGDAIAAQPFDVKQMQVKGEAIVLAQGVSVLPGFNYADLSVSQNGTLVYSSGPTEPGRQLCWYNREGKKLEIVGPPEYVSWPQLSPDGKRLAARLLTQPSGNFEIWIYDLDRKVHSRASFSGLTALAPVWSPDGKQIACAHTALQASGDHMFLLMADGSGKEQLLEQPVFEAIANYPSSWSPDGRVLLFDHQDKSGKISVWVLPFSGDRKPHAFVETQFNAQMAKFSPDGRWVAYVSNDSGNDDVYVAPFPGPGGRVQVSTGGGSQPRWRQNGRELFFLSPDKAVMAAEIAESQEGGLRVGAIRRLFALNPMGGVPGYIYDATADGQGFIAAQDVGHTSMIPIIVITNWSAGLRTQ
jgi:eukaryotic-like serine/threonine-protein kinase